MFSVHYTTAFGEKHVSSQSFSAESDANEWADYLRGFGWVTRAWVSTN